MSETPRLLRVLSGETLDRPPVWFMRQAGRSLPEYRELRSRAKDFIAFCFDPEMAAEATLQPMRRFPMDAAIVFADILLIPLALGQDVWFEAGEGPRLGALPPVGALQDAIEGSTARLANIGETLQRVRAELEPERALIGFAGAPWTVATYMLVGVATGGLALGAPALEHVRGHRPGRAGETDQRPLGLQLGAHALQGLADVGQPRRRAFDRVLEGADRR